MAGLPIAFDLAHANEGTFYEVLEPLLDARARQPCALPRRTWTSGEFCIGGSACALIAERDGVVGPGWRCRSSCTRASSIIARLVDHVDHLASDRRRARPSASARRLRAPARGARGAFGAGGGRGRDRDRGPLWSLRTTRALRGAELTAATPTADPRRSGARIFCGCCAGRSPTRIIASVPLLLGQERREGRPRHSGCRL